MKIDDIPDTQHWAILTTEITHIPGDERSRTHPGHGYPAYDKTSINYTVYTSEQEWLDAIKRHENYHDSYKAIVVNPAAVSVEVDVKVSV